MNDLESLHIVDVSGGQAYLVQAETAAEAEQTVQDLFDSEIRLYYEGTLADAVEGAERDGLEILVT